MTARELSIAVRLQGEVTGHVSGLLSLPDAARLCLVLAHGAGAGMTHPFMTDVAEGLGRRGIACLRYQFPYMQAGSRRPDRPAVATAAVRAAVSAAVDAAVDAALGLALFAGGKSFGGRMTSTAQAETPLPGVRGLVFLGFPLHPAGKPGTDRATHLADIRTPMLFVQGSRDALADFGLLRPVVTGLGSRATLLAVEGADHSFHFAVPRTGRLARTGMENGRNPPTGAGPRSTRRTDAEILAGILDEVAAWMHAIAADQRG